MKYLALIWSGIWRKRVRTALILLQIVIAFGLFGLLQGVKSGWEAMIDGSDADVLMVTNRQARMQPMPLAHRDRIRVVPGVEVVVLQNFLFGTYQRPDQEVLVMATEIDADIVASTRGLRIAPGAVDALKRTRTGALVTEGLARKYGWRVGDRVPVSAELPQKDGSQVWTFDIVGTFVYEQASGLGDVMMINNSYLDEARARGQGTVQRYAVKIADPRQLLQVASAIDALFMNSANETQTQSLRELAQTQMQQFGDLGIVVRAIVTAIFFALVFAVAALLAQTLRERVPELAILKAVGFTDGKVCGLLIAETLLVWLFGAACGLALAWATFPMTAQLIRDLTFPPSVALAGFGIAAVIGLLCAALPVWRGWRLQVAEALVDK